MRNSSINQEVFIMFVPMQAALDPVGNVSLSLQVAILFLLILGLPFVREQGGRKNLQRHGYLTVAAVLLHTVLIFAVMVPSLANGVGDISQLSVLESATVWSHVAFGIAAEVMGILLVGFWLAKSPTHMACGRLRWLMWPTFIVWTLSVVNGALVHILCLT